MRRERLLTRVGTLLAVAMALMATPAQALVQHPESEWTPDINLGPAPAVVGWWHYPASPYYNASAVAIGPNDAPTGYLTDYIITVRHQGLGMGNGVTFGNVDYSVCDEFVNPTADLRIVRIRNGSGPAALADWAAPYTGTDEATRTDRTAVIGGFGRARGTEYSTYYTWGAADNPPVQRWGQNKVESSYDGLGASSLFGETYKSNVLIASFDDYNVGSYVPYESAVAEYDSGGGWFLPVGSQWKLAGLSAYAEGGYGKSYFRGGGIQRQYPIRISSYANWIDAVFKRSTWQSTTGGWADAANWSAGVPSGTDKFAVFTNSLSDSRTVTVSAGTPFGTLRFDSLGNYTIDSAEAGELECRATIGAGAIEVYAANGAGSHTITAPIKLTSSLVINQTSTSALVTLAGPITTPGGTTGLTKVGAGTLVLSGSNTFNGGLEIQKGTVRVTSAGALGTHSTSPGAADVTLKAAGLDFRTDTDLAFTHSVKVVPLTGSTATSTLNVDRLTAGTGGTVTLGALTTDGAVTLNVTSTSGCSAAFSGKASFTNLGSSGVATINTASADLALTGGVSMTTGTLIKTGPQKLTLSGTPQVYGSGTLLKVNDGALALNVDTGSATWAKLGLVTSNAAAVSFAVTQHLAPVSLGGTSNASIAAGGTKTLFVKSLDIAGGASPSARLNLADNNLVVDYTGGASPLTQIQGWIRSGANEDPATGTLRWSGNGITSSMAADPNVNTAGLLVGVGVRQAVDPGDSHGFKMDDMTTLDGMSVGSNSVVAKFTYMGDANLDGAITAADYAVIDWYATFGVSGAETMGWMTGDFNLDGRIDASDYALIDWAATFQGGSLGAAGPGLLGLSASFQDAGLEGALGGATVVPEPGTLLILCAGAAGFLRSRRRR